HQPVEGALLAEEVALGGGVADGLDRALRFLQRERGVARDPVRESRDEPGQLLRWERAVDPAVAFGLVGRGIGAAQDDLARARATDETGEAGRPAGAGQDAECDLRLAEDRLAAGREAHVAGEGELAAAAARMAFDL